MVSFHNIFNLQSKIIDKSPDFTVVPISEIPAQVFMVQILQNTELPFHVSEDPILIYILQGEGVFLTKEKEIHLEQGILIECKAHIEHALKNTGDIPLKFMLTKLKEGI